MPEATSVRDGQIVGREAELAVLETFLEASDPPRAFVLAGGPGVGKTTLWEAGVELASKRGLRVISARASGAETQLSFAALIDLLEEVGSEDLDALPAPQRQALEVALLRIEPAADLPAAAAINVGFLNALRALAEREPLLVAIDDVQWLDAASAEAVAFAARRLDGHTIRFLLAKREQSTSPLERAYGPDGLQHLRVEPLSFGATQRLLSERLGLRLSRHVLRRVVEISLGNPLFALELGRTLAAHGPLGIGEEVPMPETVEELLGTRVAALPDPVRRLVLAVALSGDLRASQAAEITAPAALDDAVELGVLVVDGDRVRPAHPLFATAATSTARSGERRDLHRALAELVTDEESRALHLALATDGPDDELAAVVAAAAAGAVARGIRRDAVVLGEQALRLTDPASPERTERLLALGDYLVAAGDAHRLTDLLVPELDGLPPGEARVRAFVLLADGIVSTNDDIRAYYDAALAESGADRALRASVLLQIAENEIVIRVRGVPAAEEQILEAAETARGAGGELERYALYVQAWVRGLRGRPLDAVRERYAAVSDAAPYTGGSPERIAGQQLVWRGEIDRGRALLTELLTLADEQGESYSYILQRLHLCQLELRAGDWDAAAELLDEWAESSERVMWPMYQRCRALLAAGQGLAEDAEQWAAATLEAAAEVGTGWDRLEALRARGLAALLSHEPARAAKSLRDAWDHTQQEGVDEPGVFPVAPELVEALVELGELDEAAAVTERLGDLAGEQEHPWGLATAKRCGAVIRLADRYDEDTARELKEVAETYGALGLRFDRARCLLTLGRAQRRLRKWGAARDSLDQAATEFDELDSAGWAEQARSERDRVGGRKPRASGGLTPAELRVAELAADGLANKEIASRLFVTVRTVEVHLKHVYAKLGIHSRAQLARRLSEDT